MLIRPERPLHIQRKEYKEKAQHLRIKLILPELMSERWHNGLL